MSIVISLLTVLVGLSAGTMIGLWYENVTWFATRPPGATFSEKHWCEFKKQMMVAAIAAIVFFTSGTLLVCISLKGY